VPTAQPADEPAVVAADKPVVAADEPAVAPADEPVVEPANEPDSMPTNKLAVAATNEPADDFGIDFGCTPSLIFNFEKNNYAVPRQEFLADIDRQLRESKMRYQAARLARRIARVRDS
jgi:hypothetical protein